jgi:hypothetical protein
MVTLTYPLALILGYLSPSLILVGTYGWILSFKQKTGRWPNPISKYLRMQKGKNMFQQGITNFNASFEFAEYIWVVCFLFWSLGIVGSGIIMKNTDEFTTVKAEVENDMELLDELGSIKYYGLLFGRGFEDGVVDVNFQIIGETAKVEAKAFIKDGEVQEIKYKYAR